MSKTIEHLLKNSGLPGPRGNLELLHTFSKTATESEVKECFSFYTDDLHNSPEEFVVMCGIAGFCVLNRSSIKKVLSAVRKYASHRSWRIREAVAIGIQEIAENNMDEIIRNLQKWMDGNDLEKRAVVAALCEPKLLKEKSIILELFRMLAGITMGFNTIHGTLSENQESLRKTLGYGWSVAIASLPDEGKAAFEKMVSSENKHIKWIIKENLKKNRLALMDKNWVNKMAAAI